MYMYVNMYVLVRTCVYLLHPVLGPAQQRISQLCLHAQIRYSMFTCMYVYKPTKTQKQKKK